MSQEPFKVATLCQLRTTQHKEAFRIHVSDYSLRDVTFIILIVLLFKAILSILSYLRHLFSSEATFFLLLISCVFSTEKEFTSVKHLFQNEKKIPFKM